MSSRFLHFVPQTSRCRALAAWLKGLEAGNQRLVLLGKTPNPRVGAPLFRVVLLENAQILPLRKKLASGVLPSAQFEVLQEAFARLGSFFK